MHHSHSASLHPVRQIGTQTLEKYSTKILGWGGGICNDQAAHPRGIVKLPDTQYYKELSTTIELSGSFSLLHWHMSMKLLISMIKPNKP